MTASDMMDTGEEGEKVLTPVKYWRKPESTAALGSRISCMEPMEPFITTQPACTQTSITHIQTRISYDAVASNFLPQDFDRSDPRRQCARMHQATRMRLQDRGVHLGGRWAKCRAGQQQFRPACCRPRQSMGVDSILLPHPQASFCASSRLPLNLA